MNIYHTNHYLGAFLVLMDIEKDLYYHGLYYTGLQ